MNNNFNYILIIICFVMCASATIFSAIYPFKFLNALSEIIAASSIIMSFSLALSVFVVQNFVPSTQYTNPDHNEIADQNQKKHLNAQFQMQKIFFYCAYAMLISAILLKIGNFTQCNINIWGKFLIVLCGFTSGMTFSLFLCIPNILHQLLVSHTKS